MLQDLFSSSSDKILARRKSESKSQTASSCLVSRIIRARPRTLSKASQLESASTCKDYLLMNICCREWMSQSSDCFNTSLPFLTADSLISEITLSRYISHTPRHASVFIVFLRICRIISCLASILLAIFEVTSLSARFMLFYSSICPSYSMIGSLTALQNAQYRLSVLNTTSLLTLIMASLTTLSFITWYTSPSQRLRMTCRLMEFSSQVVLQGKVWLMSMSG